MLLLICRCQPRGKKRVKGKKSHVIKLWVPYGTVNFMAGVETMCSPNCAGRLGQVSFHFTLLGALIFFFISGDGP